MHICIFFSNIELNFAANNQIIVILPLLAHDRHVEVVNKGKFEPLASLVVVGVVEGLDVKEHRVTVVLSSLWTLGGDTRDEDGSDNDIEGDAVEEEEAGVQRQWLNDVH